MTKVFATEAVSRLYDLRRDLALDEEAWHERVYVLARAFARKMPATHTASMNSQTVERLITAHKALYEVRMMGIGMTNALTGGVANAMELTFAALTPGTALTIGLYEDYITEEAFQAALACEDGCGGTHWACHPSCSDGCGGSPCAADEIKAREVRQPVELCTVSSSDPYCNREPHAKRIDPPGCGCTDCLVGHSRPAVDQAEWERNQ